MHALHFFRFVPDLPHAEQNFSGVPAFASLFDAETPSETEPSFSVVSARPMLDSDVIVTAYIPA